MALKNRDVWAVSLMLFIPVAICIDAYEQHHQPVVYVNTAHAEAKEVKIEEKIDWSAERIAQEIRKVFPEAPETMVRVAKCESGLVPQAFNAKTHDSGIFQINEASHGKAMKEMDINPYDVKENLTFARYLYDHGGLSHWRASKACWSSVK